VALLLVVAVVAVAVAGNRIAGALAAVSAAAWFDFFYTLPYEDFSRSADSPGEVVEHVRKQLIGLLGLRECRFEYGMLLGKPPRIQPDGPRPGSRPPQQARLVAVTLAELAGYALGATAPAAGTG
jgi:hypothetical protein